jgi:replicative DNA helicase
MVHIDKPCQKLHCQKVFQCTTAPHINRYCTVNGTMKTPPHSLEAEQSILAACMLHKESVLAAIEHLSPEDFYDNRHIATYSAILSLFNTGRNVDLVSVAESLTSESKAVVGLSYLAGLTDALISKSSVKEHCRIVKDKSTARRAIDLATKTLDACYRGDKVEFIVEDLSTGVMNLAGKDKGKPETLADITPRAMERIERVSLYGQQFGLSTGFIDIDRRLAGLSNGDLIIIAARPSMGKTVFGVDIALNIAAQKVPVLMFSLEMSKEQIATRALSNKSTISGDTIRHGGLNENTWPKLQVARAYLDSLPMTIVDNPGLSITEIRSISKSQHLKSGLGLILVDYMQLARAQAQSREREISEISSGLKGIAKEFGIPVIALSQLNRSLESRDDKRPRLSDLRESGSIEQDADVVMFIYRDEVYDRSPDNPRRGIAEIITAKQRNGPTGKDELIFQGEFSRFQNFKREQ